jgi:HEAT repeat protein
VEDKDPEVRSHALFSLSQTNDPTAGEWIVGRLDAEKDDDVREQAVFALSQLDDGTDWLLKVLRSKRDPETMRRALFWLGQSNDPRALEEISKILDR